MIPLITNPSEEPVFNEHTYKQFRMLSKLRAHFLLNLSMQLVLTHINFSVSYLPLFKGGYVWECLISSATLYYK